MQLNAPGSPTMLRSSFLNLCRCLECGTKQEPRSIGVGGNQISLSRLFIPVQWFPVPCLTPAPTHDITSCHMMFQIHQPHRAGFVKVHQAFSHLYMMEREQPANTMVSMARSSEELNEQMAQQ